MLPSLIREATISPISSTLLKYNWRKHIRILIFLFQRKRNMIRMKYLSTHFIRNMRNSIIIVVLLFLSWVYIFLYTPKYEWMISQNNPLFIAHRWYGNFAPNNSLSGEIRAIKAPQPKGVGLVRSHDSSPVLKDMGVSQGCYKAYPSFLESQYIFPSLLFSMPLLFCEK